MFTTWDQCEWVSLEVWVDMFSSSTPEIYVYMYMSKYLAADYTRPSLSLGGNWTSGCSPPWFQEGFRWSLQSAILYQTRPLRNPRWHTPVDTELHHQHISTSFGWRTYLHTSTSHLRRSARDSFGSPVVPHLYQRLAIEKFLNYPPVCRRQPSEPQN